MSPQDPAQIRRRPRGGVALLGIIGGYVTLCIVAGLGLGLLADRILGTAPLFLIAGVVVGFVTSFYFMYRVAMGEMAD